FTNDRKRAVTSLAAIAGPRQADRWFRLAVLSSVANNPLDLFQAMAALHQPAGGEMLGQLAGLIGTKHDPGEVAGFLAAVAREPKPDVALSGLAHGMQLAGVSELRVPGADGLLARYLESDQPSVQSAAWEVARHLELAALIERAQKDALAANLPLKTRVTAIRALRGGRYVVVSPVLRKLLDAHEGSAVEAAAIESLAAFDDP